MALALELAPYTIDVQNLNTYFVVSSMSKIRRASLLAPTAKDYVRSALKSVGPRSHLTPYPLHAILQFGLNLLPEWILLGYTHQMHKVLRQKALKRLAKSK